MQVNAENELDYLMVFILSQNLLINGIISEDVFNSVNKTSARFLGTYEEPLFPHIRKDTSSLVE